MLLFLVAFITFLTDNIMMCLCLLIECAILSAITCLWAFSIIVSLSAADAVLPDIAIKNKYKPKNKLKLVKIFYKISLTINCNFPLH